MKKLLLIKKPELFQGEKKLIRKKDYFEGWYFKNTTNDNGISFIPGININKQERQAFIQIITNSESYFINYDIEDFTYGINPFYVRIKNNYFSKDRIHIDIIDDKQNLRVYGNIKYSNGINIDTNMFSPNIMGLFSYVLFMECNHAILSMKTRADGLVEINDNTIKFDNGIGYIEKDWGCSFPKNYIWCQGNNFQNEDASFMLSIANIPFNFFDFRGIICSLIVNKKEYRFATYNGVKLIKYEIGDNLINIALKKGCYYLEIESKSANGLTLTAPVKGKMEKDILESINATINVTLQREKEVIFSDASINCGLEIVY